MHYRGNFLRIVRIDGSRYSTCRKFSNRKNSLKSGGSRLVAIDNLSVQFDGLQALMYRLAAPICFVIRFVPEVGHGERAFVDTQVGAIHARHYTGPGAICPAEIICKYMFLLIFYAYARSAGLRGVAMSFWMISQTSPSLTSADGVGLAIIFLTRSSTERIGFKKNSQPDPWYLLNCLS